PTQPATEPKPPAGGRRPRSSTTTAPSPRPRPTPIQPAWPNPHAASAQSQDPAEAAVAARAGWRDRAAPDVPPESRPPWLCRPRERDTGSRRGYTSGPDRAAGARRARQRNQPPPAGPPLRIAPRHWPFGSAGTPFGHGGAQHDAHLPSPRSTGESLSPSRAAVAQCLISRRPTRGAPAQFRPRAPRHRRARAVRNAPRATGRAAVSRDRRRRCPRRRRATPGPARRRRARTGRRHGSKARRGILARVGPAASARDRTSPWGPPL